MDRRRKAYEEEKIQETVESEEVRAKKRNAEEEIKDRPTIWNRWRGRIGISYVNNEFVCDCRGR
jgi:hypothetical protein